MIIVNHSENRTMQENGRRNLPWADRFSIGHLIGAFLLLVAWMQWGRCLAWDELEFIRATQWVGQGRVPYRDFWEHHGPLQWFLMAPLKLMVHGPGASTVIWMRWMQMPFWALAGACVLRLLRRLQVPNWMALAACTLPMLSPLFTLWAVEYRPDTVSSSLFLAGLAMWRMSRRRWTTAAAGTALTLCSMANLRMAGLAAFTFLLCLVIRPASRRWGIHRRWPWLVLGGCVPFLVWSLYLVQTKSASVAYRFLVVDNRWFNGLHSARWANSPLLMPFLQWDFMAMILVLAAVGLTLRGVTGLRRPGPMGLLALIQVAQVVFVSRLSVHYPYHLQGILLVAVLQLAVWGAGYFRSLPVDKTLTVIRGIAISLLILLAYGWVHLAVANSRATLADQNRVMVKLDRELAPTDQVLDGVGYALRHEPAYAACWFLPTLGRSLTQQGRLAPYTREELLSNPPGAIIFSGRVLMWLEEWPALQPPVSSHFLPETPFIWKPGLSARLDQTTSSAAWRVPRTGSYRIHASEALATHPWFKVPFRFSLVRGTPAPGIQLEAEKGPVQVPATLEWRLNGATLKLDDIWIHLRQGDRLQVNSGGPLPIGIFLVPQNTPHIFQGCRPEETLDSDLLNIWPAL